VVKELSIIEGAYLLDILDQPRALLDTSTALTCDKELRRIANRLNCGGFRRVVLTGMGASFHALHVLHLALIAQGFTSLMLETSELVHYQSGLLDGPKTLLIVVSQSGQSAEIVRLLRVNRKRCPIIAVTNTAASTLARQANAVVLTYAGVEFSVSCKTYVSAIMALQWLGEVLCQGDAKREQRRLMQAATVVEAYLASWRDKVEELVKVVPNVRHLFLLGRGNSLAAVGTGALVLKEASHFPAEGMSSAAFRHGPFEMLDPDTLVLVFGGERKTRALSRKLVEDIRARGGGAQLIGEDGALECCRLADYGSMLRPFLEILPIQMLTLGFAALRGLEAGRFVRASKITSTE
jgi:glutamine---fructose-6-phosphate transaminase (isomerizing)